MAVTFRVQDFEGPLDLLLQLVEQEELDISNISLAKVAEQFLDHVNEAKNIPPEELADFLVVAAKLMYMKSKLLLPSLVDEELEEGPDLETQLREYQKFVAASREIDAMWKAGHRSFVRADRPMKRVEIGFAPPPGVTSNDLAAIMRRVIARIEPIIRLPKASIERIVSIQEKIRDLFQRIKSHAKTTFHTFLKGTESRTEAIVSFLALLELVKQRFVLVDQKNLFNDIDISASPDAPEADPLAHSFV
ncbi:MAG: segregation/condensation protein A [Patescibacteria group bacterium]|jgi:segregation and condensation protein A